jgi:hypothetical protein
MNPGKAMAQASHAANAMVHSVRKSKSKPLRNLLDEWENETSQGFGTCIVLECTSMDKMEEVVSALRDGTYCSAGIVHDPSYPLRDGKRTHLIPLDTCAWVFARKNNEVVQDNLDGLDLHL